MGTDVGERRAHYTQGWDLRTSKCTSSERLWCPLSIVTSFTYNKLSVSSARFDALTGNHCYDRDTKTLLSPRSFLAPFVVRPFFFLWSWATHDPLSLARGVRTQLTPLAGGADPGCVARGPKLRRRLWAAHLPAAPPLPRILLE